MDFDPLPQQRLAIEAPLGPVLVVAGPGAGKTFCLIARINHLINTRGLAPERICAVTFTNRAAEAHARGPRGGGHARHDPRVVSRPAARARRGSGPAEGLRRGRRAVPEGHPGPAARAARAAGIAPEPVQPAPRAGLPLDG